nr:MAG TPA: hypothetical protein [Caudoviricetes sp.]
MNFRGMPHLHGITFITRMLKTAHPESKSTCMVVHPSFIHSLTTSFHFSQQSKTSLHLKQYCHMCNSHDNHCNICNNQ